MSFDVTTFRLLSVLTVRRTTIDGLVLNGKYSCVRVLHSLVRLSQGCVHHPFSSKQWYTLTLTHARLLRRQALARCVRYYCEAF